MPGTAPYVDRIEMNDVDPFPVGPQKMSIRRDIGGELDDMPSSLPYRSLRMLAHGIAESIPCRQHIESHLGHRPHNLLVGTVSRDSTHKRNDHIT